ncbi:hypothetical protein GCM10025857_28820 [Alicyclobacillus contaminans]|uniref:helix-turn-helix domain-containing protein n=1 Tax=Alicyclobacillus contaminans TaxID=392016 RepID=UPI0003F575F7|nr:helix-turn-helix transcriptional regulator [Alicyclobacillus contaminans]GMA51525.1 hypothetical protein GCM10025857_28820 [Alicyclobacillus contaminans]
MSTYELPWEVLKRLRRERGYTQTELAAGVASPTLLSHVETGRVLPSERMLHALAGRLGVDGAMLCALWRPYRQRHRLVHVLWRAFCASDWESVANLLHRDGHLLGEGERWLYAAWVCVQNGELREAELWLKKAWFSAKVERGIPPIHQAAAHLDRGRAAIDVWRWLAVEAAVHVQLCLQLGRTTAAEVWTAKYEERLRKACSRSTERGRRAMV